MSLLFVVIILISNNIFGQEVPKKLFLNGTFNYFTEKTNNEISSTTPGDTKDKTFILSPRLNGFISNNFILGGGFEINFQNEDHTAIPGLQQYSGSNYSYNAKLKIYNLLFFTRYIKQLDEKLYFYFQLDCYIGNGSFEQRYPSNYNLATVHGNISNWGIETEPGLLFHLSDKWALETSIGLFGYKSSFEEYDFDNGTTIYRDKKFNFGFDLTNISFGVDFFF